MALDSLADAFYDELRDVLSAEKQALKAMPKMRKAASCEELKAAFEQHLAETEAQVQRVQDAFEETGKSARAKSCEAMKGLIEETQEMLAEEANAAVKDAVIISCAQKQEHYEIASYGTLCTWAEVLGYSKALNLLKENLAEEEATDEKLTSLAHSINREAAAAESR